MIYRQALPNAAQLLQYPAKNLISGQIAQIPKSSVFHNIVAVYF